MDSKLSEYPLVTTINGGDILPIISGGANRTVTAGVFALNLPNVGNKGITKNVVTNAATGALPLTSTLIHISTGGNSMTLAAGTDGQEITIVSGGASNTVTPSLTLSNFVSVSMGLGSSITLVFVGSKWIPKSYHDVTFN